jgi:hypothetical protein
MSNTIENKRRYLFGGSSLYVFYFFNINRIELEQSDGEKDRGVFVDENLSFNKHIQNQVNKANSIMGLIRRTYTYLETQFCCHRYYIDDSVLFLCPRFYWQLTSLCIC